MQEVERTLANVSHSSCCFTNIDRFVDGLMERKQGKTWKRKGKERWPVFTSSHKKTRIQDANEHTIGATNVH